MYSEIIKLELDNEIDGFERTVLNRLLDGFESIELEAREKRKSFLYNKSKNFDPDRDDEACILEDGYFEELNYILIETTLKQEFLNSAVTWLFHLFERQKKRVLGSDKSDDLKPKLSKNSYTIDSCSDWTVLNKELRLAANAIKHGEKSEAAQKLLKKYPCLFSSDGVSVSKNDIKRYLESLRKFWEKALDGQIVL